MRLAHLPLPGQTRYAVADALQEKLVRALLAHKASPNASAPPRPTILTAEFHPVYTIGRREHAALTLAQQAHLTAPVNGVQADFAAALRGGQTTFHGPGQLVAYPILDLKRHGLGPRDYICLLEGAVIATLARFGVAGKRTENPGVWTDEEHKICALGVHMRRYTTSHGIGLNVSSSVLPWFDRITACGLVGKKATSLEDVGVENVSVSEVGKVFVQEMAKALQHVDGVDQIGKFDQPD